MGSVPERDELSDAEIRRILSEYRSVAVVGMSRDPSKAAHYVPAFLIARGYKVIPVNPTADEILGIKAYKSLAEVDEPVDIVDVFRPSEQVPPVAKQALKIRPKVFWMQEGIVSSPAIRMLSEAGITVVWNRCIMREYNRLLGFRP